MSRSFSRRAAPAPQPVVRAWAPRILHALLGALVAGYLLALIVRPAGDSSTWLDGWSVDAFELVVCGLALSRGLVRRPGRRVALALGAAMLSWTLGDVALTIESLHGATPPSPSVADAFYLAFYPLAYLALALLFRRESNRLVPATWLDGAVAGLGAAALLAAFAFDRIVALAGGGSATAVAANLAYPIGDVLLLAMAFGGCVAISGLRRGPWLPVAIGCGLNAIGDTFNLVGSAGATHLGVVVNGIAWPAALLLMSVAVWMPPSGSDLLEHRPAPGFLLPGLGALSGLIVLLAGAAHGVDPVAVGLATATLGVVGVRLSLSTRSMRILTEQRHFQAVTDQLTGLGNRRRLSQVLDGYFAEQADPAAPIRRLAFLFVDLDHFKEVNDSFGHPAGDQLLRQIGPRIQSCLRDTDLLVRIGGDELAVILLDTAAEQAALVAARVAAVLEQPFDLDAVSVGVGVSIGIAVAPEQATDAAELMRCADHAMYRAKQGGTSHELYDPARDSDSDRLGLLEDLRLAIVERRLEMHYQPQIDLRTGAVSAVEALLRWTHPERGPIPPLDFLPLAEEAGLMRPLTELVLDQSLAQCARWRAAGHNLSVAVNVSATNVLDAGFTAVVRDRLDHHRVPARALVLEITETTIISDFDRCRAVVDELCALGCTVSIDDFGAGFTSLPYLSRLTIGELKLDRTFLQQLTEGRQDRDLALIRSTIELAHALGLKVVAEGVEEQATLQILSRLGCDMAQGFHIGRPGPAAGLALPLPPADLAA